MFWRYSYWFIFMFMVLCAGRHLSSYIKVLFILFLLANSFSILLTFLPLFKRLNSWGHCHGGGGGVTYHYPFVQ